jgi:hypothetical protein
MEPEVSFPCSQEPIMGPFPERIGHFMVKLFLVINLISVYYPSEEYEA